MSDIPAAHRHTQGRVVFLADLHLDAARPAMLERFRRLCRRAAAVADPVYILGDLFEVWIGDDDDAALAETVIDALAGLTAAAPAWFMPGNRDFLVGEGFVARAGLGWLDDPAVIELFGHRTLLCHGDTLCTDDVAYQRFRAEARTPAWRADFLARPLAERRRLAASLRDDSRDATAGKDEAAMDVNPDAVAAALRAHDAERLIHGHTHRPARHRHRLDGRVAERWVLADWYDQPAVLVADADGIRSCAPEDL